MNILPKKRWHVRTKENIARVRKDEAEAAEKERQEKLRIEIADREARLKVLKEKSKKKLLGLKNIKIQELTVGTTSTHINLFANIEHSIITNNKDHDKEVKDKKEEYEKKIGYLTYLGQDTNEALKKKNWYEVVPETSRYLRSNEIKDTYNKLVLKDKDGKPKSQELNVKDGEIDWKYKQRLDPISGFKSYCHHSKPTVEKHIKNSPKLNKKTSHKKHKQNKKGKNHKEDTKKMLQKLREARFKREQEERCKTELYLKKLHGSVQDNNNENPKEHTMKPKYNSQFNPELARQNYK